MWLQAFIDCFVALGVVCVLTVVFGRRPLDRDAFTVCLLGCLAAGLVLHIDGLSWERGHRNLWLEAFCLSLFWPCAFLGAGFGLAWFLRRCRSERWFVIGLLAPGAFGAFTGFFYAALDSCYEAMEFYTNWYSMLLLPGAPADGIARIIFIDGCDWQGSEIQYHMIEVAFLNGVVWFVSSAMIALPLYFVTATSRRGHEANVQPDHFTGRRESVLFTFPTSPARRQ